MQLPETPPPPLAPLWDRVLRARTLPPDLDVQLLYIAIKDRLTHPEWEVRLHALRVLADLLPLSGNALSFPFDQVVDNLGHSSPNVRKAALDALKVFCTYCEEPECAARAILDKCSYNNIRPQSADFNLKTNVVNGLILSVPTLIGILKRRYRELNLYPLIENLGEKLFDPLNVDVALRSLIKLRRVCGPHDYALYFSRLDPKVQNKFRYLCEVYDEDSLDVYYAPRRPRNNQNIMQVNQSLTNFTTVPFNFSTDSSSDSSLRGLSIHNKNFAKVIIETEIKFDSDTAITMTVLEQNESDKNIGSDEEYESDDRLFLKYSDPESEEDSDVVVKRVRFGGESVKIRTPDSDNVNSNLNSEDDLNGNITSTLLEKNINEILPNQPAILEKANEIKRESFGGQTQTAPKKSGIPLPIIHHKRGLQKTTNKSSEMKLKSRSLGELYDYFNKKRKEKPFDGKHKDRSGFALTLSDVITPEKVTSPVESHREIEVLHNLQRSPTISPRRSQTRVTVDSNGFVMNLISSSPPDSLLVSPRPSSSLKNQYEWENLNIVEQHVAEQLHNTENWIAAVKAADQLHGALLESDNVTRVEPAALSLVQHMWALSDTIPATKAPAEGVVCAVVRNSSSDCIRNLLPSLLERMMRDPPPTALPHALLQRIALHNLVDLLFDPEMISESNSERAESARLRAAMCLSRAAGPAAVLAAVRRSLADSFQADVFCNKLRSRLNTPMENARTTNFSRQNSVMVNDKSFRMSYLPVPTRRRARSTPPAAPTPRPRRLRPLPDSAPLPGILSPRSYDVKSLTMSALHERDSSADTNTPIARFTTPVKNKKTDDAPNNDNVEKLNEIGVTSTAPSTPSIQIEDFSEKSHSLKSIQDEVTTEIKQEDNKNVYDDTISQNSESSILPNEVPTHDIPLSRPQSEKSLYERRKSYYSVESVRSLSLEEVPKTIQQRDVRAALSDTIMPAKHEDWEAIISTLQEMERLAEDETAKAPAASWRAVVRAASAHVRSLRSRVARAACSTLGSLFEFRGKILEPEVEEAAGALLERCADANRFLRAEAATALGRVACGTGCARAGVALARKGATHRAGPVRAAAAQALAKLTRNAGPEKILDLPTEPRIVILRAAGELLSDAHPDTRLHARHLCNSLSEDSRFHQMLKEAMGPNRYRAIEKYVEKLRCR